VNHESDDFARWRFTPRTVQSAAQRAYAGSHSKPQTRGEAVAGVVLAVVIGIIGAALLVHWWAS
jgi:hypothetical protein